MTTDPTDMPGVEESAEFASNMAQVMQRSQEIWARMVEANAKDEHPLHADPLNMAPVMNDLTEAMMSNPQELAEKTLELWTQQGELWRRTMMGSCVSPTVIIGSSRGSAFSQSSIVSALILWP